MLDLVDQAPAADPADGAVSQVEPEVRSLTTDEVKDGEAGLAFGEAQSPPQLLQKYRGALGWAQEEDGVHLGNINSLVKEVDSEQHVDLSFAEGEQPRA